MSNPYFVVREFCPSCNSTQYSEIYSTDYVGTPVRQYLQEFYFSQGKIEFEFLSDVLFILDECIKCGLVYQRLVPNDFLVERLYEEWIAPQIAFGRAKYHDLEYYRKISRQIETMIDYAGVLPDKLQFLDFGMGWGQWCRMARAHGCTVSGLELSQARIDYVSSFGVPIIQWNKLSNHQFDFINANQVFEHLTNPLETLTYLGSSLKPEGIIRISVPNGDDIKRRLAVNDWTAPKGSRNSLNPVAPLEHLNCFSYGSLVYMATLAGLVPVEIQVKTATLHKKVIDLSLRDILRPFYKRLVNKKQANRKLGTDLFFKRKMSVKL